MDSSHHAPASRPPRRGLRGNRPTLLRARGSYRSFKKLPPRSTMLPLPGQVQPPVIIHEVSPKVIHVPPEGFKETVQRLTGRSAPGPCFEVHDEQVRHLELPDQTRGETSTSTFGITSSSSSQLDFSIGPAPDNALIPSSGANQDFSMYDMGTEFDDDNPTSTGFDTNAPSQALDEIFRF